MKVKLAFLVLYAILSTPVKCIKVIDDTNENNSTITVTPSSDVFNDNFKNKTESVSGDLKESRTIGDSDDKLPDSTLTTPSTMHKIPPTLLNVMKVEPAAVKEKPERSLMDFAKPTPASIQTQNSLPEGRLKQAIIHSKQQSFKNVIEKSGKYKDQIARPNEVQADIAVETPSVSTSTKSFVPSPELSPLYTRENNMQDNFQPVNQYYRPPMKQDIHFPHENSYPSHVDSKWPGGNSSPNDNLNLSPHEINPHFMQLQGRTRNTHVDYPHHHHHLPHPADRQVHYHNSHEFSHHFQQNHFKPYNYHGGSNGEKMVFPSESSPFSDEAIKTSSLPSWPTKIPELNKNEKMGHKGSWKWVPDVEDEGQTSVPEGKFHGFHPPPPFYDPHRPQTVKDRPYAFESSEIFSHHTTPPTGPGSSSGATAEALVSEDETTLRDEVNHEKDVKSEIKILRPPSPWKRFLHVMTAAIPIGIIISALTPRFVYIHPNATAPTMQPPFSQQPFSPPPPILPPSSPQNPSGPLQQFQQNQPFPLRQRAEHKDVNESLTEFMSFLEANYREKHGIGDGHICEDKFFCELALIGADPDAELMHRTLYKVAIETPKSQAEKSGLNEIFTAIKRHNCEVFKCKRT